MKFRPPRDGSGDRRGNDAAYRLLRATTALARGRGKESWKKDRGWEEKKGGKRKRKKNKSGGRGEETRPVSRVRGVRRG